MAGLLPGDPDGHPRQRPQAEDVSLNHGRLSVVDPARISTTGRRSNTAVVGRGLI